MVAQGGKMWILYKRPGQRVLINPSGDLIVRPSYTEITMQQRPFGARVAHHLLQSYKTSLLAILKGQLTGKQLVGGVQVDCALIMQSPRQNEIKLFESRSHFPLTDQAWLFMACLGKLSPYRRRDRIVKAQCDQWSDS